MPLDHYLTLGRSGLAVSPFCLGTMTFGEDWGWGASVKDSQAMLDAYLGRGGNFIDTANAYTKGHSEKILGDHVGRHRARRERVVIATKFSSNLFPGDPNGGGAGRKAIVAQCEQSLRRLQTDYLDLYWMHAHDPHTPIEETLRALDDLVRQGKVRYIGCSNLAPWQVADAMWTARHHGLHGFISTQDEYSLLVRDVEKTLFPVLGAYGLGLLPYFPLAGGLLTGKYKRGAPLPAGRLRSAKASAERFLTERNWAIVEGLDAFCAARNRTLAELAFSWLASHREVSSIIAGATTPEQIDINVAAAGWRLAPDELAEIDRIAAAP